MAKPVSEEELQLKKRARRRLIGAIALVAAVATVLPMVLDSEPKPASQEINIQIPSPDAKGGFASKVVPVPARSGKGIPPEKSEAKAPATAAVTPERTEKAASKAPDNPNDTALALPVPKTAREKATAKAPEKAAEKAPAKVAERTAEKTSEKVAEKVAAPKAGPGMFFIQVIALSDVDKAKQVQQKVIDTGVRAYTEIVAAGAGKVTRVRAGPFATREEAESASSKLQRIGLEGKVASY